MQGFTTTPDGSWVFNLEDPVKPELPVEPNLAVNYLDGPGKWDNYSDQILYECDSLIRQFFESKLDDPHWRQPNPKYRKYTVGMMYQVLFGEKFDVKKHDTRYTWRLATLMAYYSTRIQNEGSVRGKVKKKKIYTLSLKRYMNKPPYSLKLRVEWYAQQGVMPTWHNMKLPKDDLKAGHARNKKTDENMERRRERARARYRERYGGRYPDRAH